MDDAVTVNVRFPRDLHRALIDRANVDEYSVSALIRIACRHFLANTQPITPKAD
jgi:hypothetical protein